MMMNASSGTQKAKIRLTAGAVQPDAVRLGDDLGIGAHSPCSWR